MFQNHAYEMQIPTTFEPITNLFLINSQLFARYPGFPVPQDCTLNGATAITISFINDDIWFFHRYGFVSSNRWVLQFCCFVIKARRRLDMDPELQRFLWPSPGGGGE